VRDHDGISSDTGWRMVVQGARRKHMSHKRDHDHDQAKAKAECFIQRVFICFLSIPCSFETHRQTDNRRTELPLEPPDRCHRPPPSSREHMSKEQSKVHAKLRDGIEGWQKAPTPRIFRGYVAESKQRKKREMVNSIKPRMDRSAHDAR
jgi:hypothetical protein